MLHLAEGATVLPRDAHSVLSLFDQAGFSEHQDALGIAHLVGHKLRIIPPHRRLIPADSTDTPLPPTERAPLTMPRHRRDRLAFQLTALAHHRVAEMDAGLTACTAVMQGGLALPQFLYEPFHSARDSVKSRDGKRFVWGAAIGEHRLSPHERER